MTASSTSADISRGVETATSTPQTSLNSHSFFGWLTRPTVRGTPNSVLASSDITRLALSSPVAAIATSQVSRPASSSEDSSQASASSQSASVSVSDLMACGSLSISRTSWPFSTSSRGDRAADVAGPGDGDPHLAPFRARFRSRRSAAARTASTSASRASSDRGVDQVAVLEDGAALGHHAGADPEDERHPGAGRVLDLVDRAADPGAVDVDLHQPHRARRVAPLRLGAGRQQPAEHLVGGPAHRGHGGDARAARRPRRGPGRRSGRPRCRRRRSPAPPGRTRMLELSPLETAAKPSACSMPASSSTSRSKPTPLMVLPAKSGPSRRNASTLDVDHRDGVARASPGSGPGWSPTRPQPMITMCTIASLVAAAGSLCRPSRALSAE